MKQTVVLSLILISVFTLFGCQGKTAPTPGAVTTPYKVAVLTMRKMTTPADLSTLQGIEKLRSEYKDMEIKIIECITIPEYKEQILAVSEAGYDVVYFIYDNFLAAVKELAPKYPNIKYIGLWIQLSKEQLAQLPNVEPLFFHPEQGSFVAGYAAAKMTKTGKIGFLGGGNNPGIVTFLAGYEAGMKYADKNVELVITWANTFEDPVKGKALADNMYSRGVDVIFQAANLTGLGVFKSAEANGKFAIGCDVDQSPLAPDNIIGSVLLDHGYATYDSIKKAYMGEFANKQVIYGLAEGMPVFAPNTKLINASLLAEIETIQQSIADGKIEVPITTTTTK